MNNKKKEKITPNLNIDQKSSAEIPYLSMDIIKSKNDFVTKKVSLESKGWDIQEAITGMEYLLSRYKRVQKEKETKEKPENLTG